MVDIFDEISEELRADRARALLVRYGGLLVGLCLAVVIAVAVWQWRQAQTDKENQRVASLFIAAAAEAAGSNTESGRAQAIAEFAAVERQGHAAYTALARLDEAELRSENGDLKGALVLWDQVAGDGSAAPAIRDLAVVLWVQHQLDQGDPVLLAGRLAPVLSPSNVWHGLASEEMALIQLRQGQTAAARERLQALEVDSTVSQNLRSRAAVELASLGG